MKIEFLGGAEGVTGSKTLVTLNNQKYLIDYGLFQGGSKIREGNWKHYDLSDVHSVFLTHAHVDHSGLIPRLITNKFKGHIYCTEETYELCKILLMDSARIHEEDARYANKKKYSRHKPALPLYTTLDAQEILKKFIPVKYGERLTIAEGLNVIFHWAGHILGSSFIKLEAEENDKVKTVIFSGDIGHGRSAILQAPEQLKKCDLLVLESTYGKKIHARTPAKDVLGLYLKTILKRDGVAILPSFSVGRTQEVLYLIKKLQEENQIPKVPVLLDSPLSKKANSIFLNAIKTKYIKEELVNLTKNNIFPDTLKEVESVEESKAIHSKTGPMIIVSASGMLDGGRVVHHVKKRITNEKNGIILVGFQPEGTKGRLLLDGIEILRLHKEEFPVKAGIFYVNALSAHADFLDIVDWLESSEELPRKIILNHGEKSSSDNLKNILEAQLDLEVTVAKMDTIYTL